MCTRGKDNRPNRRAAFTLLEVIIATMIIALLTMSLYRFITTTLQAIQVTTEVTDERQSLIAVTKLLGAQLNELPPRTERRAAWASRSNSKASRPTS